MHHKLRRWLSPSTALAGVALIAATSGTAVAAGEIITSPDQVANKVITEPKLADGAVTTRAVADGGVRLSDLSQPTVAAGVNRGISGGRPFLINPTSDVESVEGPESGAQNQGSYTIRFANPVRHCHWSATTAAITGAGGGPNFFTVRPSQFDTREVFVFARKLITVGSNKGETEASPASFYLMGRC